MAIGSNNWIFLLLSFIIIIFNCYIFFTKNYSFDLLIGEQKENYKNTKKVSLFFKIKFIHYMISCIVSIITVIIIILSLVLEDDDLEIDMIKIWV